MSEQERAAAALRAWRRTGGRLLISVTGRSMAPLLTPGDLIVVEPINPHDLLPGAIVVAEDAAGLLTHRLVRLDATALVLWGDALPSPDPPLAAAALLGVATIRERSKRRLQLTGRPWTQLGAALIRPRWRRLARFALTLAAVSMRGDAQP